MVTNLSTGWLTFAGKVVLVTGAAGAIGTATATRFRDLGADVHVSDVSSARVAPVAAALGVTALALDVRDLESWREAVSSIEANAGGLDVLVNNAGRYARAGVLDAQVEDFQQVYDVNQLGCLLGMQTVAPALGRRGGGAVVNLSSTVALNGSRGATTYAATKWAVRGLTQNAALELGPLGIRVNAVLPGSIHSDMTPPADTSAERQAFFDALPVPRQGRADDVADAVCFLASERAAYITGAELIVDGGLSRISAMPSR